MQSVGRTPLIAPNVKLSPTPHQKIFKSTRAPASLHVVDCRPVSLGPMLTDARRLAGVEEPSELQTGNSDEPSIMHTSISKGWLHVFLKTSVEGDHENML